MGFLMWLKYVRLVVAGLCCVLGHQPGPIIHLALLPLEAGIIQVLNHWFLLYPSLIHSKANTPLTSSLSKCAGVCVCVCETRPFPRLLCPLASTWSNAPKDAMLEACGRDRASKGGMKAHTVIKRTTCILGQTRIFHTQLRASQERESQSLVIPLILIHFLSLSPTSFLLHSTPSCLCSNTQTVLSRKLNSFPSNFFLYAPASVTYGIFFSSVTEGPRERRKKYGFPNSNFIAFSVTCIFP